MNANAPAYEFGFEEVAAALFAAHGIKSGLWRVAAKLRFAGITVAFPDETVGAMDMPTGMVGIEGLALFSVTEAGQMVFDAATGKASVGQAGHPSSSQPTTKSAAAPRRSKSRSKA